MESVGLALDELDLAVDAFELAVVNGELTVVEYALPVAPEDQKQLLECLSRPGVFVIAEEKRIKRLISPDMLRSLSTAEGRVGHRYMLLLRGPPAEETDLIFVPGWPKPAGLSSDD